MFSQLKKKLNIVLEDFKTLGANVFVSIGSKSGQDTFDKYFNNGEKALRILHGKNLNVSSILHFLSTLPQDVQLHDAVAFEQVTTKVNKKSLLFSLLAKLNRQLGRRYAQFPWKKLEERDFYVRNWPPNVCQHSKSWTDEEMTALRNALVSIEFTLNAPLVME